MLAVTTGSPEETRKVGEALKDNIQHSFYRIFVLLLVEEFSCDKFTSNIIFTALLEYNLSMIQ